MNWYKKTASRVDGKNVAKEDDFKTYRKTGHLLTLDDLDIAIKNNLEGVHKDGTIDTLEGKQKMKDGDVLCKGVAHELWPQPKSQVENNYTKLDTKFRGRIPWQEWKPKDRKVKAFKVEDNDFFIDDMEGKKGDYIVHEVDDSDAMWIVDQEIFEKSYDLV